MIATQKSVYYYLESRAAMHTRNLIVHQWLMTTYPHLVLEYTQYDDSIPFQPLQLSCAITDIERKESMHGKFTVLVRYHLRYQLQGVPVIISFGLGPDVAVTLTISLPTLCQ